MEQAQQISRHEIFPSTVVGFQFKDCENWNPSLKRLIEKEQAEMPGVVITNQGGWHSDKSLHSKEDPGVQALLRHVRQALSEWALNAFDLSVEPQADKWDIELWANVNGPGHSNRAHDHFRSGIVASGCYYLQTNGREGEARIVFVNQQSIPKVVESAVRPRQHHFAITPRIGQCLIFPSWLGHLVEPHSGETERISLAFNAGHPDLMVKRKGDRLVRQGLKQFLKRLRIPA